MSTSSLQDSIDDTEVLAQQELNGQNLFSTISGSQLKDNFESNKLPEKDDFRRLMSKRRSLEISASSRSCRRDSQRKEMAAAMKGLSRHSYSERGMGKLFSSRKSMLQSVLWPSARRSNKPIVFDSVKEYEAPTPSDRNSDNNA